MSKENKPETEQEPKKIAGNRECIEFGLNLIDQIIEILCKTATENAKSIPHGITFMTGTKQHVYSMGGVEAISGVGVTLDGIKQELISGYNNFVKSEAEKDKNQDVQVQPDSREVGAAQNKDGDTGSRDERRSDPDPQAESTH